MLLFAFSSNVTPRIFFATARPPGSNPVVPCGTFLSKHCRAFHSLVQTSVRSWAWQGNDMVEKIALEEHVLCPGFEEYWKTTVGDVDPAIYGGVLKRLTDFGDLRLEAMDRAGIARSVLSLAGP